MSTSMEESLYNLDQVDMDAFACLQRFNAHDDDIDPRLLSEANSPMSTDSAPEPYGAASDCDFALFSEPSLTPQPPPFFDPDMTIKYEPLRHEMLGHRRSVSVPPEDMDPATVPAAPVVFHRGGHYLGDSTANPNNSKRWHRKSGMIPKKGNQLRHMPYPSITMSPKSRLGIRRTQTQPSNTYTGGPTSAPSSTQYQVHEDQLLYVETPQSFHSPLSPKQGLESGNATVKTNTHPHLVSETELDSLGFGPRTNANTAALGMLGFATRFIRDCETMRDFLNRGFSDADLIRTYPDDELESLRQEKRAFNHTVHSLQESLDTLPFLGSGLDVMVPATGQEIRDLDVEKLHALLDLYGIPYAADMFLHDKKVLYLRFLGASRGLMHAVLD